MPSSSNSVAASFEASSVSLDLTHSSMVEIFLPRNRLARKGIDLFWRDEVVPPDACNHEALLLNGSEMLSSADICHAAADFLQKILRARCLRLLLRR